jgi:tetratricopeptide (TPR) repeat protein
MQMNFKHQSILSFLLLMAFLLVGTSLQAQYKKDLDAYLKADDLQEKAKLGLKLWNPLMRSNLDSLKTISFELMLAGAEINDPFVIAVGKRGLGTCLNRTGDPSKGVAYLQQALVYFEKAGDMQRVTEILNEIGIGYFKLNRFKDAEEYYMRSLKVGVESSDPTDAFLAKINLGHLYIALKNYEKAASVVQFYKNESLKHGKLEAVSNAYALLGTIEQKRKNVPLAMEYFQKSADFGQKCSSRSQIAHALNNLAIVHFELGDTQKTMDLFRQALELRIKTGNAKNISESYFNLGGLYFEMGDYQKAAENYLRSKEIAENNQLKRELLDALMAFAELYKAMGKNDLALATMEEYAELQEEYYAQLSSDHSSAVEVMESVQQIEAENDVRQKEENLLKLKQSHQRVWYVMYGLGALTLTVLLVLLLFKKKIK